MKKKTFIKRSVFWVPAAIIGILIVAVLYAAYLYIPYEDRAYDSPYLKTVQSRYVVTPEFKIHYIHEGKGVPVVLIHGDCSWLYSFRENFSKLAETFSVYAIDTPGHGYTIPLCEEPSYDLDMMSRGILDFLDAMDIQKASLVGHSAGGGWAMHFAGTYPDRVEKMVLIDSNGMDVPVTLTFKLFTFPVIGELFANFFTFEDVKKGCSDAFYQKHLVTDEVIREVMTPLTFFHNRVAQYRCIRNQDWKVTESMMPQIEIPKLVIWGKEDRYLDYGMAHAFKSVMPNTEVVVLENCGHSSMEEMPEKVNALVTEFLKM